MKPSELYTKITQKTGFYNIQVIDNIPSIMRLGLLSNEKALMVKHESIAMQEIQVRRDKVLIPNGLPLHKYANLYFDPRNPMLYKRKSENGRLCILKFDKSVIDIKGAVVSDRNASSGYASFYQPKEGLEKIDFQLVFASDWTDANYYEYFKKKSIKCAEVLVPNAIPYDYVVGAAVCDETAGQALKDVGFDKKIIVEPGLFF